MSDIKKRSLSEYAKTQTSGGGISNLENKLQSDLDKFDPLNNRVNFKNNAIVMMENSTLMNGSTEAKESTEMAKNPNSLKSVIENKYNDYTTGEGWGSTIGKALGYLIKSKIEAAGGYDKLREQRESKKMQNKAVKFTNKVLKQTNKDVKKNNLSKNK